ncbi:MAG: CvpA family protein [Eubacteriales bacterium]|nr:CvpA family protein [Eubacteriales bacterium]
MLLDLAILILILIFALNGFRRGFLVLAGRLLILVVSLLLSLLILGPTAKFLAYFPFLNPIVESINDQVIRPLIPAAATLGEAVKRLDLPQSIESLLLAEFPNQNSPLTDLWPQLSSTLGRYVITAVVFFMLLTIISILIGSFVGLMTNVLDHVPVIGGINRISGLLLGLVHGSLIIACVILAIGFLAPFIPILADLKHDSRIVEYVYQQDLIARGIRYFLQTI